jgi:hypothetical protein
MAAWMSCYYRTSTNPSSLLHTPAICVFFETSKKNTHEREDLWFESLNFKHYTYLTFLNVLLHSSVRQGSVDDGWGVPVFLTALIVRTRKNLSHEFSVSSGSVMPRFATTYYQYSNYIKLL